MAAKKTNNSKKGKGGGVLLLTAAISAALAAGAGYYATHKEEVDREAKKKADELAKAFKETKKDVEHRVQEVWGEVSTEAVAAYMDVRGALLHALEEENLEKTGKMLRKNYLHAVDVAVKKAREAGMLDKETEKSLAKILKMDWDGVQEIFSDESKKVTDVAKKEINKAAKKVIKKTTTKTAKRKVATKTAKRKPVKRSTSTAKKAAPKKAVKTKKKAPVKKTTTKKTTRKK